MCMYSYHHYKITQGTPSPVVPETCRQGGGETLGGWSLELIAAPVTPCMPKQARFVRAAPLASGHLEGHLRSLPPPSNVWHLILKDVVLT